MANRTENPTQVGHPKTVSHLNTTYKPAGLPDAQGLYSPEHEHDACGVGMICSIRNEKSRKIIDDALAILCNLEHRGAV